MCTVHAHYAQVARTLRVLWAHASVVTGRCCAGALSAHMPVPIMTPGSPDHAATPKLCRDPETAKPCCDTKSQVTTRGFYVHSKPGGNTKSRSRPLASKTMSRHQKCVATPSSGRNPPKGQPMSRNQNHVATPLSPNSVVTSKQCRDTTSALLYRDTKSVPRHQFLLPCSFHVATPKAMLQHPQQLPQSGHGKSCRDSEPGCPNPAMSRPGAKEKPCRACNAYVLGERSLYRTLLSAQPPGRARMHAVPVMTPPAVSRPKVGNGQ